MEETKRKSERRDATQPEPWRHSPDPVQRDRAIEAWRFGAVVPEA